MALHSMAKGMVSAPLPPGLTAANGNGAAATNASANPVEGAASAASQAACDDAAVGRRAWVDERSDRQALMDDVRRAVLEEIDAKVAGKMKDLWAKGNKMLKQVEQENQQKNAKMLEEIEQCRLKQDSLKAEHEHLKRVLAGMVNHFNMLGAMFGSSQSPKAVPPMPASVVAGLAAASSANGSSAFTDAPTNSSAASSTTIQDSPSSVAGGAFPPLPAVPDFPFPLLPATATPTSANGVAASCPPLPLSLAEALGSENGPSPSVPVSLMGSLPATQKVFSFTLRKADGTDLGLNVSHHEEDKALRVEGVRPEGAVEAWNRQCIGSIFSEKAVCAGDRIISVNGVTHNPVKMLEECRDKQLLKITVLRGEAAPAAKPTTLRADASEFVPSIPAAPGLDPPAADEKKEKAADSDADDAYEVVNKAEDRSAD